MQYQFLDKFHKLSYFLSPIFSLIILHSTLQTQLKSLAKIQDVLIDVNNLKNATNEIEALTAIGQSYTTETLKSAIAQSTLNKAQITTILSANGLQGEYLKTTVAEIENAISTKAVAASQKKATGTTLGLGTAFKGLCISIKNATAAMVKFLFTTPAGWATLAVGAITAVIVGVKQYRKNITKAAEESKDAINEITDSYKKLYSTVSDIKKRYAELAQGVNQFTGKNKTLSNDEYAEFLDLSNQLAELFPSLTKRYDENENAILNLSGNVNTIVDSLTNLVEVEKQLANQKIIEELPNVLKGYNQNRSDLENELKGLKEWQHNLEAVYESLQDKNKVYQTLGSSNDYEFLKVIDVLSKFNIEYEISEYGEEPGYGTIALENYDDSLDKISKSLKTVTLDISNLNSKIKAENAEFNKYLSSWLFNDWSYVSLDPELQNIIQEMLFSTDWLSEAKSQRVNTKKWNEVSKWIEDNYISAIADIDDDKVKSALIDLYTIPTDEQSISGFVEQFNTALDIIQTYCEENGIKIPIDISENDIIDTYNRLKNSILRLSTDDNEILDSEEEIEQGASKVFQNVKEAFRTIKLITSDEYANLLEYTEGFTQAQVEIWLEATSGATSAAEAIQMYEDKLTETAEAMTSFEDAWADSFTSEKDEVKKLGDSLLDLAEKGRLTIETFNNTDSTDYFKNLGISAEEAVAKINKLVDESKQLSSMSNQISKMSEALGTKSDDGFVSADTLSGFDAEVRGLESWDRFQELLGSTTSSYDECQEAANALATEWINNSDFLAQLTEQNKEYYETQLKAMCIENYEEIIAYAQELNSAKEALSQASFDLATATSEEIQALIADGEYTELAEQQIWALILAKQTEEGVTLNTSADCQNLLNLAKNAGVTGDAITLLTRLMNIYNNIANGVYGNNYHAIEDAKKQAEDLTNRISKILANGANDTVKVSPKIEMSPSSKSSASSAGKDAAKAFTDALDKELAALDKKMEAGYIDFNDYIQARLALIEDYYNQGKLSADEYYSYLEKHYDTQLSYMDKVVNAVTRRIDAEIDALKQQKEDVEDIYKVQIESLEKEKTLLEEANKERQRQIDLQKSLYDLERARNQRTNLIYSEDKGIQNYIN